MEEYNQIQTGGSEVGRLLKRDTGRVAWAPLQNPPQSPARLWLYLQGDETPVDYLEPGHGKTKRGYFWVIHNPTHGLISTSRA